MNALEHHLLDIGSRWVVEHRSMKLRRDCVDGHVHASLTTWMGSERQVLTIWRCGRATGVKAAVVVEALHDLIDPASVGHTELVVMTGADMTQMEIEIGGEP